MDGWNSCTFEDELIFSVHLGTRSSPTHRALRATEMPGPTKNDRELNRKSCEESKKLDCLLSRDPSEKGIGFRLDVTD